MNITEYVQVNVVTGGSGGGERFTVVMSLDEFGLLLLGRFLSLLLDVHLMFSPLPVNRYLIY